MKVKNKSQKSIKKNFIYNTIYQVFLIIVPVIVTPYLSRVLGAEKIGQYSYSASIVSYFTLFAGLGFSYYAQREIAKFRDSKESQSKIFWEICIVRFFSTAIATGLLFIVASLPYFSDYQLLLYILSANVLATSIDTSFLFQGNEDFKQIAIRNFLSKSIVILAVFIFVKDASGLWIYVLIQALSPILSALVMFPFLRTYLVKVKPSTFKPFRHLKPCLKLFVPTIAVSVYTILDKTMIGVIVSGETTVIENGVEVTKKIADLESGYYNQAEKIIKLFATVVASLGTVMIPRNAYYFATGEVEKAKENVWKGLRFAYLLSLPLMFGIIAVADNFSPWFFGDGYEKVPLLMKAFAPIILAMGLNNVFGNQYLIPSRKDTTYTLSVVIGACANFALNCVLIYFFQSLGAVIASVCAETIIFIFQMVCSRKEFNIRKVLTCGWKYIIASLVMFVPCFFMGKYLSSSIVNTFLIVLVGVATYGIMLLILRDDFAFPYFVKIKNKIFKNHKDSGINSKQSIEDASSKEDICQIEEKNNKQIDSDSMSKEQERK